jgi:hypothetical protein
MLNVVPNPNLIVATHMTGVFDVNRNTILSEDDFTMVEAWANSIEALKLHGIIFHNNFSEATCQASTNEFIKFVRVDYNQQFNPNVFRYAVYNELLHKYSSAIANIFFTDISDVVVTQNPFVQQLYVKNPNSIFCGDEPQLLDNEWMQQHSNHLRSKIADYNIYEELHKKDTLLNCGIFGGNVKVMTSFIQQLWSIHQDFNYDNTSAYTGDMGAFNYLIRTQYKDRIFHGAPINSEFKAYSESMDFWFRHK